MELIFIYIGGSADDFIRNQGFNFSCNYNFYVSFCYERYELRQKNAEIFCRRTFLTAVLV